MLRLISYCLALILPTFLHSENVSVRSAIHQGSTRVVLYYSEPSSISLNRDAFAVSIKIPNVTSMSGLESFFDRIDRSMLSDLSFDASKETLNISLACDCDVQTSTILPNLLVIDFTKLADDKVSIDQISSNLDIAVSKLEGDVLTELVKAEPKRAEISEQRVQNEEFGEYSLMKTRSATNSAEERLTVFLNKNESAISDSTRKSGNQSGDYPADSVAIDSMNGQVVVRDLQQFQTSDLATLSIAVTEMEGQCSEVDIANPVLWAGLFSSYVTDEDTVVNEELLLDEKMALLSVFHQFLRGGKGAEALRLIPHIDDLSGRKKKILSQIIKAMDGEKFDMPGMERFPLDCENLFVWRYLQFGSAAAVELSSVRNQFIQWPVGLRSAFGARLASRFFDEGEYDASRFILTNVSGLPEQRLGETQILQSKLDSLSGDTVAAENRLRMIVDEDQDVAADALVVLANRQIDRGELLSEELSSTVDALTLEARGEPEGLNLLRLKIRNELLAENYDSVWQTFAEFERDARIDQSELVLDQIGRSILNLESVYKFLRNANGIEAFVFQRMSDDLQMQIIDRMKDLGFDDLARLRIRGSLPVENSSSAENLNKPVEVPTTTGIPEVIEKADESSSDFPLRTSLEEALSLSRSVLSRTEQLQKDLAEAGL